MIKTLRILIPIIDLLNLALFIFIICSIVYLFFKPEPITLESFTNPFAYFLVWLSSKRLNFILAKELYRLVVTRNN